ncbi:hypothetical protein ABZ330_16675 [Streptomyces sp. NPDC006172]|uniref:hypothetical protein n=1 Tax=Streptomyces sp. NPDC006172 TaxID=3154470 RepID=UPI0033EEE044
MIVTREAHEIDTDFGKLYIQILQAQLGTVYREDVLVEEIKPRVWVATDPQFKGEAELGHLKIRGRAWTISHQVQRLTDSERWSSEPTYDGPYRNEKGKQVEYRTKTYDLLYGLEREALDRFAKEHPYWEIESLRQRLEYNRNHELGQAKSLAKELTEAEARAANWQARIDELTA